MATTFSTTDDLAYMQSLSYAERIKLAFAHQGMLGSGDAHMDALIQALREHNVEYVIVGGFAAILHGSTYTTLDLDVCYNRTPENIDRIFDALKHHNPVLVPNPDLLFTRQLLTENENFTLKTDLGLLYLLSPEWLQMDGFMRVVEQSIVTDFGRVLSLDALIDVKEQGGREQDLLVAKQLREIRERQNPQLFFSLNGQRAPLRL